MSVWQVTPDSLIHEAPNMSIPPMIVPDSSIKLFTESSATTVANSIVELAANSSVDIVPAPSASDVLPPIVDSISENLRYSNELSSK